MSSGLSRKQAMRKHRRATLKEPLRRLIIEARSVTQDNIALSHCGGRRNPARSKTALKQFVGTGGVIEKSNCSDGAYSVCVKHQELFRRQSNDDVVSEFVLSHHYM